MPAERVLAEPREQIVEHLLADPPRAPRGELQSAAVPGQVTGLLEPPSEVVERVEVPHRVVAEQLTDVSPVDRRQVVGGADIAQLVLQRIERLEQLRPLAAGMHIGVARVAAGEGGVDTPADAERAGLLLGSDETERLTAGPSASQYADDPV